MTTIRYFIPEDGDDELNPNVFLAAKPRHPGSPPTLGQIRDAFPLPGRYHFRFKSPLVPGADRDKGCMAVWMDCTQDNAPVPTFRGTIVAKVTRVGVEDDDDEDDHDFVGGGNAAYSQPPHHHHSAPAPAPPAQSAPRQQPAQQQPPQQQQPQTNHEPFLNVFDEGHTASSASSSHGMPTSAPTSTGNLLDGHHAAAPSSGGLLDMDAPYGSHGGGSSSNAHSDFLGMTAPPSGGYNPGQYGQPQQAPPQQQQQQQQQQYPAQNNNAFSSFSDQQGPFGGLGTPWK